MTRDARSGFIELVEEQLEIGKREVERGRVVVRTRVEERDEVAEIELQQEDVSVERVPLDVPVEALPPVREEDGVLIIPVVGRDHQADPQGRDPDHPAKTHRVRSGAGEAQIRAGRHPAAGRSQPRIPIIQERSSVDDGPHAHGDV